MGLLRMSTYLKSLLVIGLCFLVTACGPRGETKTLDEVFQTSKARFTAVQGANVPQGPAGTLQEITGRLEQLAAQSGPQSGHIAGEVADLLASLASHAGYTARPAIGEIVTQYRMFSNAGAGEGNAAARLLVARTYNLLASELETTKFSVQ